jgi:CheY-like chemotaxis protein
LDEAENGRVAVEKFMKNRYDAVLMDIQMPVMDGYAATREIRAWENQRGLARTPIIALTASVLDEAVGKSFEAGCDTHVSKPVRRNTLMMAIKEVTTVTPQVTQSREAALAGLSRPSGQRRKLQDASTVAQAKPGAMPVLRR